MALTLLIVAMAGVTYLTRYLLIALLGRWTLPPAVGRWLTYIPIAIFTTIAVQGTLTPNGDLYLDPRSPYLWGAACAGLVAWWRRNVFLTIAAGLGGLWLARLCFG